MIDLDKLKAEERKAHKYGYALDFYIDNWDALVAEIADLRDRLHEIRIDRLTQEHLPKAAKQMAASLDKHIASMTREDE